MAARITIFHEQAIAEVVRESKPDRVTIANRAAADAESRAPVYRGHYRSGIGVEVSGDRVAIVDNDPDAFYKEYGTSDTSAHASVTRAASNYGRYSGMKPRGA